MVSTNELYVEDPVPESIWMELALPCLDPERCFLVRRYNDKVEPLGMPVVFFREGYKQQMEALGLPWEEPEWSSFRTRIRQECIPSALLMHIRGGAQPRMKLGLVEHCVVVAVQYFRRRKASEPEAIYTYDGFFVRVTIQRDEQATIGPLAAAASHRGGAPAGSGLSCVVDFHLDSGCSDFLVKRTRYIRAMSKPWNLNDRVRVFYMSPDDLSHGEFFFGRILGKRQRDAKDPARFSTWETIQILWDEPEGDDDVTVTTMNMWEIEPARGGRKGENDSDGEEEDEHIARNARIVRWLPSPGGELRRFVAPFRYHRPALTTAPSFSSNSATTSTRGRGRGRPPASGRGRAQGGRGISAPERVSAGSSAVVTAPRSAAPPPTMAHNPEQIENDWNDDYCSVCNDGGEMICCDGTCLRAFHVSCLQRSELPPPESGDDDLWFCRMCRTGWAECAECKELGKAEIDLFKCSLPSCGRSYHLHCLAKWGTSITWRPRLSPSGPEAPTANVPAFVCPCHVCMACNSKQGSVLRCIGCPMGLHRGCLPDGITADVHEHFVCQGCTPGVGSFNADSQRRRRAAPAAAADRAARARAARPRSEVSEPGDALQDQAVLSIFSAVREAVAGGPRLQATNEFEGSQPLMSAAGVMVAGRPACIPPDALAALPREGFVEALVALHASLGKRFKVPVFAGLPLDLYKVFIECQIRGGYQACCVNKEWTSLCRSLNVDLREGMTSMGNFMKRKYESHLLEYEDFLCRSYANFERAGNSRNSAAAVDTSRDLAGDQIRAGSMASTSEAGKTGDHAVPATLPTPPETSTAAGCISQGDGTDVSGGEQPAMPDVPSSEATADATQGPSSHHDVLAATLPSLLPTPSHGLDSAQKTELLIMQSSVTTAPEDVNPVNAATEILTASAVNGEQSTLEAPAHPSSLSAISNNQQETPSHDTSAQVLRNPTIVTTNNQAAAGKTADPLSFSQEPKLEYPVLALSASPSSSVDNGTLVACCMEKTTTPRSGQLPEFDSHRCADVAADARVNPGASALATVCEPATEAEAAANRVHETNTILSAGLQTSTESLSTVPGITPLPEAGAAVVSSLAIPGPISISDPSEPAGAHSIPDCHVSAAGDDARGKKVDDATDVPRSSHAMAIPHSRPRRNRGVEYLEVPRIWLSHIQVKGQKRLVGAFTEEMKAARAYDLAMLELYPGLLADGLLNFTLSEYQERNNGWIVAYHAAARRQQLQTPRLQRQDPVLPPPQRPALLPLAAPHRTGAPQLAWQQEPGPSRAASSSFGLGANSRIDKLGRSSRCEETDLQQSISRNGKRPLPMPDPEYQQPTLKLRMPKSLEFQQQLLAELRQKHADQGPSLSTQGGYDTCKTENGLVQQCQDLLPPSSSKAPLQLVSQPISSPVGCSTRAQQKHPACPSALPRHVLEALPREGFVEAVAALHTSKGRNFKAPTFAGRPLDIFKVFMECQQRGGYKSCCANKEWTGLCRSLGMELSESMTNMGHVMRCKYERNLLEYEEYMCRSYYHSANGVAHARFAPNSNGDEPEFKPLHVANEGTFASNVKPTTPLPISCAASEQTNTYGAAICPSIMNNTANAGLTPSGEPSEDGAASSPSKLMSAQLATATTLLTSSRPVHSPSVPLSAAGETSSGIIPQVSTQVAFPLQLPANKLEYTPLESDPADRPGVVAATEEDKAFSKTACEMACVDFPVSGSVEGHAVMSPHTSITRGCSPEPNFEARAEEVKPPPRLSPEPDPSDTSLKAFRIREKNRVRLWRYKRYLEANKKRRRKPGRPPKAQLPTNDVIRQSSRTGENGAGNGLICTPRLSSGEWSADDPGGQVANNGMRQAQGAALSVNASDVTQGRQVRQEQGPPWMVEGASMPAPGVAIIPLGIPEGMLESLRRKNSVCQADSSKNRGSRPPSVWSFAANRNRRLSPPVWVGPSWAPGSPGPPKPAHQQQQTKRPREALPERRSLRPRQTLDRSGDGGYLGVTFSRRMQKWRAQVTYDDDLQPLGVFPSAEEAARAYDTRALELFGNRAQLNFPRSDYNEPGNPLGPEPTIPISTLRPLAVAPSAVKPPPSGTEMRSAYIGVSWDLRGNAWTSFAVGHRRKRTNLGSFATEEDAARAYDRHVLAEQGPQAITNFPSVDYV